MLLRLDDVGRLDHGFVPDAHLTLMDGYCAHEEITLVVRSRRRSRRQRVLSGQRKQALGPAKAHTSAYVASRGAPVGLGRSMGQNGDPGVIH